MDVGSKVDLLSSLSTEICLNVLWFLPFEDYLNLGKTCWSWYEFCNDDFIFKDLLKRDFLLPGFLGYEILRKEALNDEAEARLTSSLKCSGHLSKTRRLTLSDSAPARARQMEHSDEHYWMKLYQTNYTWGSLKTLTWEKTSLDTNYQDDGPPGREGHDMALLGDFWILWGGFVNDMDTYVMDTTKEPAFYCPKVVGKPPSFRYGHSMTALEKYSMIVVFGGLSSGGYISPLNDVWLLHLRTKEETKEFRVENQGIPFELEWVKPDPPAGVPPTARGYHSACASPDGNRIYFFGGIGGQFRGPRSCVCLAELACLDIPSWSWIDIAQEGTCPPRMAHSSFIINNQLWMMGGGWGNDLVRSGHDLYDLHVLDLNASTPKWQEYPIVPVGARLNEFQSLGRTHCSIQVGSKIVFFAGARCWSNDLCVFDTETKSVYRPETLGIPPCKRMSPKAAFKDGKIWVWGGYSINERNLGDLWYLHLEQREDKMNQADDSSEEEAEAQQGPPYCIPQ